MGSSTGNMLVDNANVLENVFSQSPMLIATHCEHEATVRANAEKHRASYGDEMPAKYHPIIRNEEVCFKSSSFAVELAKKYNTRLHILHITTAEELALFTNTIPLEQKRITSEVCVHHLWFDSADYERLGMQIKANPAVKEAKHKIALLQGLLDNKIDIIATDHAPHTWAEKQEVYWKAPSGVPLVQHSLNIMLDFYKQGKITIERIVEKMSHAPAICFQIEKRGFLKEGYWADIVLVDVNKTTTVEKNNLYYKCGWSPFEHHVFQSAVTHTIVSGHLAYHQIIENGLTKAVFDESVKGKRILFDRK
jgi:dihydroorotase